MARANVWGVLFFLSALSACTSDGQTQSPSTATPSSVVSASESAPPEDLGSIVGTVVSEDGQPVAAAEVTIVKPISLTATTDAAGRFEFQNLVAGTYTIFAQKLGYEQAARQVTLAAGETKEIRLVAKAIEIVTPYNETKIVEGYWMCDAPIGPVVVNCQDFQQFTGPRSDTIFYDVGAGWNMTVFQLMWKGTGPTSGTANDVYCFMEGVLKKGGAVGLGTWHGSNPWRLEFVAGEGGFPEGDAYRHYANCYPKGMMNDNGLNRGVGVVIDQRWKVYASIFYHGPAPMGYAVPPE